MAFNNWSMVAGWGRRCKKRREGTRKQSPLHKFVDQAFPPHGRVARGAAQVNVNYFGGGVEGCCPGHYILHRKCPQLVGRLLHLVVGDEGGGGAWYCARVSAATSGWDYREASWERVCWDMVKESVKELYERETVENGANSYEIRTNFTVS